MLCATHDGTASDAETSRRTRVDADWKAAMGVDDDFEGIAPRTSTLMRVFGLLPKWAQVPMVVAVLATVITSQAVITAFSVTRQGVQLGFLPRSQIHRKSGPEGQVYVPATNWLLYVAVIGFGSSTKLASAYGIAATGTFVTTTLLFFVSGGRAG